MGPELEHTPSPPVSAAAEPPCPPSELPKIPPLIARGHWQFKRDLPELLEKYRGQWVVYRGTERLAVARNLNKMNKVVDRMGLPEGEYVIRYITPWDADEEVDPEEYLTE